MVFLFGILELAMKTLYYLVLEYTLVARLHLKALWQRPPTAWGEGSAGDVLLIPGFGEPWTFLSTLANELHSKGYKIHVIPELTYSTQKISECVTLLHAYVQNNALTEVIVLAHSKGGIVAKQYVDNYPTEVKKVISISTPFQGTAVGHLRLWNLKELIPHSPTLQSILSATTHNSKIVNLYARIDNHILPNKYAVLPGAINIEIPVVGHTRILEHAQTSKTIQHYLHI